MSNRVLSTVRHPAQPSVRTDSSILEEIQVLWPQSYATEIIRCCHVPGTRYALSTAVGNAMLCHYTGYDTHDIRIL